MFILKGSRITPLNMPLSFKDYLEPVVFKKLQIQEFSSVQFSCSVMSDSLQPHESQHARPPCPSPSPRVHADSTSIESVMPSSHLILGRPLLLLPPVPPSIRVFSSESTLLMSWPKYWSFSFSITHPAKRLIRLTSFFHTKGLPLE